MISCTRLRRDAELDGHANMARDAELLRMAESGRAGGRVYRWDGAWVSLGRFQSPSEAVVPDFERWVSRPTGGRAVLHGHDVTVALAVPTLRSRELARLYQALVSPIVAALNACGRPARLAGRGRGSGARGADCFAFASPYDVVDPETGAKVCGCALRVTARAALLQASVPYRAPLVTPARAIRGAAEAEDASAWRHEEFADALESALAGG